MTVAQLIENLKQFEPHTLVVDADGLTPSLVELDGDCAVLLFDPEAQDV